MKSQQPYPEVYPLTYSWLHKWGLRDLLAVFHPHLFHHECSHAYVECMEHSSKLEGLNVSDLDHMDHQLSDEETDEYNDYLKACAVAEEAHFAMCNEELIEAAFGLDDEGDN